MRVIIQNRKFNSMEYINVCGSKYDGKKWYWIWSEKGVDITMKQLPYFH